MEAAPPSYETATLVDHWDIIAGYIPSDDLCSAALVCRQWNSTFSRHLWGNPASHFGIENDRVYVALTKFRRTLQTARLSVRSQTHTLHLPPAHAEIYYGPHTDWLKDVLCRLPNLQSLIVRGLPFFDHAALMAVGQWKPEEPSNGRRDPHSFAIELPGSTGSLLSQTLHTPPTFGLRLLDASRCLNVTSNALAQALKCFDSLMYLDLSHTYPARDIAVMSALRRFSGLQVLKLRGINLRDADVEILAKAIGRRVRSLDVRDNHITDTGVSTLLNGCFTVQTQHQLDGAEGGSGARSPALLPYLGAEMLDTYQGETFEGFLRNAFTNRFVSRLAIEDAPEGGITHLYISNNKLSVEGVSGLTMSERLHVLDAGTVLRTMQKQPDALLYPDPGEAPTWNMPSAEKLAPVLYTHAKECLTYLKLDHSILTRETQHIGSDEVIPGCVELADTPAIDTTQSTSELDGTPRESGVMELPADAQSSRYELPGDSMHVVVTSPQVHELPAPDRRQRPTMGARTESASAPEAVGNIISEADKMTLLTPVSPEESTLSTDRGRTTDTVSPATSLVPTSTSTRPRSYSTVASDRIARLNAHRSRSHTLHPAMLPHLRTLILTDFPAFSSDDSIAGRLINFIKNCASEAYLARAQAKLDYSLPPGRRGQASALRHSAEKIFALKRIVLEIAPERPQNTDAQRAKPWHHVDTKSMTEDRDSEALWSAAETDFSFFGEDGEESSFPSIESERPPSTVASAEKEVSFGDGSSTPSSRRQSKPVEPKVDNIALLAAFRKGRLYAYQRDVAVGAVEPETEGYWDGMIQIVRPSKDMRHGEELDYYGNKFEKNYLYR